MNKNQKTYLLLGAVIIIWSAIGYQVYIRLNPTIPELKQEMNAFEFQRIDSNKRSEYVLKEAYRDPFLGGLPSKKKRVQNKVISKPSTTQSPTIVFNGVVQTGRVQSFILTINGAQQMITIGEVFSGVKLLKGNKNRVVVKFGNRIQTVEKSE